MHIFQGSLMLLSTYLLVAQTAEYRILGVFHSTSKSQTIFSGSLMKVLAKRGHLVDVITTEEMKNPPKNYNTILSLEDVIPHEAKDSVQRIISEFEADPIYYLAHMHGNARCNLMGHEKLQNVLKNLKSTSSYDLVITETYGANCYIALGHYLNIPVITISAHQEFPWEDEAIGNPTSTAFFPGLLTGVTELKTFSDRFQNSLMTIVNMYRFYFYTEKPQTEALRKYLSLDMPNIREIERTVALTLVNTHFSLNGVRPTTPALVEVGGLHIFEDKTTLRPKLKKWMDESEHGVVYFSMGVLLDVEYLPNNVILAFYASFAKLQPMRVLMKVGNKKNLPPGLPKNVKTLLWVPQIPVLGHKNTKVFISHGGLMGCQEALHYGVPVIGIPTAYDQFLNIQALVKKNVSIRLNYKDITETALNEALTQILHEPKYRQAAQRWSRIFRDRPLEANDYAAFWVEYILRNGAISLRSPAVDMYWWQIELLDVYAFVLFSSLSAIYAIGLISKIIFRRLRSKERPTRVKTD